MSLYICVYYNILGVTSSDVRVGHVTMLTQTTCLEIEKMSEFNRHSCLHNLYVAGNQSAQELSCMTGIPLSTVYDNLKNFRSGSDASRQFGSGKMLIYDVNNRHRVGQ